MDIELQASSPWTSSAVCDCIQRQLPFLSTLIGIATCSLSSCPHDKILSKRQIVSSQSCYWNNMDTEDLKSWNWTVLLCRNHPNNLALLNMYTYKPFHYDSCYSKAASRELSFMNSSKRTHLRHILKSEKITMVLKLLVLLLEWIFPQEQHIGDLAKYEF